jgi:hypothetical protein
MAHLRSLVSTPFQNFAFTEGVFYKLFHIVVLVIEYDGPKRTAFCAAAHSLLLAIVNASLSNAQCSLNISLVLKSQIADLETSLSHFLERAVLLTGGQLEPKDFEVVVELLVDSLRVWGPEIYIKHKKMLLHIAMGRSYIYDHHFVFYKYMLMETFYAFFFISETVSLKYDPTRSLLTARYFVVLGILLQVEDVVLNKNIIEKVLTGAKELLSGYIRISVFPLLSQLPLIV